MLSHVRWAVVGHLPISRLQQVHTFWAGSDAGIAKAASPEKRILGNPGPHSEKRTHQELAPIVFASHEDRPDADILCRPHLAGPMTHAGPSRIPNRLCPASDR